MAYQPVINNLPIGEARVACSPATLTALGSRSCFTLLLYDSDAHVGGLVNLRVPGASDPLSCSYVTVSAQRLLAEMRGQGARRAHLAADLISGEPLPPGVVATIEATLRQQGIQTFRHHPAGGTGCLIRFSLSSGRVILQQNAPLARVHDARETAMTLGSRLLDLHPFHETSNNRTPGFSLERMLQQVASHASQVLGGAPCLVALETSAGALQVQASSSRRLSEARRQYGQGLASWALGKGRPLLINDHPAEQETGLDESAVRSFVGVPLVSQGRAVGVLCATHPTANAFGPEDLRLMQMLSEQAMVALKNVELYQQLQERAQEMESILQGIGDGLLVADVQLRLVMANPAAQRLLHLNAAVGDPLPDDQPLTDLLRRAAQSDVAAQEIELRAVEGSQSMICQVVISRLNDADGQVRGLVAVLRDITAQKEMERLKSNLLTVVSHELKTPLHSISGFVDIILMGKTGEVNELQRDFLSTVKQQSTQLQNMINDLLEFSRLECGQIKLTTEPMHLADIARSVLRKFELIAHEHQALLTHYIPDDLPLLEGDPVRLEQVLTNLVDNALKFTPPGGRVTIGAVDQDDALQLWVQDTGVGIPLTEQARIFEKFYQAANHGASAKRRGAGLGLSICKQIVERHQGRIWFDSTPGQGSTFYVLLPKQPQGQPTAEPLPVAPESAPAHESAALLAPTTMA